MQLLTARVTVGVGVSVGAEHAVVGSKVARDVVEALQHYRPPAMSIIRRCLPRSVAHVSLAASATPIFDEYVISRYIGVVNCVQCAVLRQ